MEKIYVFGHKKPDTDSVTSAIGLSYLKNQLGLNTEARILGDINNETKFVLDYFKVDKPKYLNDVKLQVKDVNYHRDYFIDKDISVKEAYEYMTVNGITGVPIVDKDKNFISLITVKNITKTLINGDFNKLHTSYDNIIKTLLGEEILKVNNEIDGNITVASFRSTTFMSSIVLKKEDILIVGDRHSIIEYAVKSGVQLIIVTGNGEIKDEHLQIAKDNNVNIIRTSYDTFHTSKLIGLSNYVESLVEDGRPYTFDESDYYDEFVEKSTKLKHNNYPIVDKNNKCRGLIRMTDIDDKNRKKVILVDHNEEEQSAEGLDEAEIIEVVDHHKIGSISTNNPINFRNMSVGSSNTIIYYLYNESKIEIPDYIKGLMISGILSDTLVLSSPTTTELDKRVVERLSSELNLDYKKFAIEMFKAGTSLVGKTKEEIVNEDIKIFSTDDDKFGISQVFTLSFEEIENSKEEYINIIERIAKDKDYRMVIFLITDIINNGSYIYYTNNDKSLLELALNIDNLYQGYFIKGCVSRKKQVVPLIMEIMR